MASFITSLADKPIDLDILLVQDRLYGLVVRVRFSAIPDFLRSSGSGKGSLSLVSTIEELLERKNSDSVPLLHRFQG
jgi:hypothetical protein